MLTEADKQRIRDLANSIPPETKRKWLEARAAKGNLRAQRALERMDNTAYWDDMVTIGLFHLEAWAHHTGTLDVGFAEWSEKMAEELGETVIPDLDEIWKRAQREFYNFVFKPTPITAEEVPAAEAQMQSESEKTIRFTEIAAPGKLMRKNETSGRTVHDWILDSFTPRFKKGCLCLGLLVLVVCVATVISVLAGLEGRGTFPIVVFLGLGLGCFYANAKEKRLLKQIDAYLESETANILNVHDEDGINYLAMEGIIQRTIGQLDSEIVKWYSNRDGGSREMRTKIKDAVLSAYRKLSSQKMRPVI